MTIVEAVDEVKVSRATAAGAHTKPTCDLRIRARGERGHLLMWYVQPLDGLTLSDGICQAVERVPHDTVHTRNTSRNQRLDEDVTHFWTSFVSAEYPGTGDGEACKRANVGCAATSFSSYYRPDQLPCRRDSAIRPRVIVTTSSRCEGMRSCLACSTPAPLSRQSPAARPR